MFGPVAGNVDLPGDGKVELFHLCAGLQVEHAEAEEVERLFTDLLGIVPRFEHACLRERLPDVVEFLHQFMVIFLYIQFFGPLGQGGCLQYLKYQYRMVCREGTTRLGDNVGVGYSVFVGCIHKGGHRVVHIFLNGIVDTVFGEGGTGAVIIHSQATTDIDKLNIETHGV